MLPFLNVGSVLIPEIVRKVDMVVIIYGNYTYIESEPYMVPYMELYMKLYIEPYMKLCMESYIKLGFFF